MTDRIYNVPFLCTGKSARSILAEAVPTKDGAGRFCAFSAGSHPKGEVNPLALKELALAGYPIDGLRSKSWDEFAAPGASEMDFVFTVCDNAAGETCPHWPGQPMTAHWGIAGRCRGQRSRQGARVRSGAPLPKDADIAVHQLPLKSLDEMSLRARLREIGQAEGASHPRQDVAKWT